MTPEAQRIAIAEVCGWQHRMATRDLAVDRGGMRLPNHFSNDPIEAWWKDGDPAHTGVYSQPPRYLTDLNAMHEAWRSLPWEKQCAFSLKLHEVAGSNQLNHVVNATAAQRAEAFLRALSLWVD